MGDKDGPNRRWNEELIGQLQYLFITTKRYSIDKVAREMGMEYDDLYAYVSGRRTIPAAALVKLVAVTRDLIFLDVVCVGSPIHFFWKDADRQHSGDIAKEMAEIGQAVGAVYGELRKALEDDKITSREAAALMSVINGVKLHLDDLQDIIQKKRLAAKEE